MVAVAVGCGLAATSLHWNDKARFQNPPPLKVIELDAVLAEDYSIVLHHCTADVFSSSQFWIVAALIHCLYPLVL